MIEFASNIPPLFQDLPFVRRAVQAGDLTLHGWYFDLVAGALLAYSPRADAFLPVVCPLFTEHA